MTNAFYLALPHSLPSHAVLNWLVCACAVCRIKMVKADKVSKVTQTLVARAKAGQIRAKIDDAQLVEILGDAGASERSVTVEVS